MMGFQSPRALALLALSATSMVSGHALPKRDSIPECTTLNQRKAW